MSAVDKLWDDLRDELAETQARAEGAEGQLAEALAALGELAAVASRLGELRDRILELNELHDEAATWAPECGDLVCDAHVLAYRRLLDGVARLLDHAEQFAS